MKRANWIRSATYYYPVLIYVGTWKQLRRYVRRKYRMDAGKQQFGGGSHWRMGPEGKCGKDFSVVWLPEWDKDDWTDIRILSHELLHAAMAILFVCRIEYSHDHQEALCYLHEELCRAAHESLTSNTKERK